MSDIINIASQCLRDEAQAVLDQIPLLDDNFERAVKLILDCKGKLIVTGVGKILIYVIGLNRTIGRYFTLVRLK